MTKSGNILGVRSFYKRYIIREGAAAWNNRCMDRLVSATLSGSVAVANAGREWLHGAIGFGRE